MSDFIARILVWFWYHFLLSDAGREAADAKEAEHMAKPPTAGGEKL
jgi:hypothetical protein